VLSAGDEHVGGGQRSADSFDGKAAVERDLAGA
jgi:hypothetical protein